MYRAHKKEGVTEEDFLDEALKSGTSFTGGQEGMALQVDYVHMQRGWPRHLGTLGERQVVH